MHDLRDVGGTRGGLGLFVGGLALLVIGGYLLLDHVTVYGGFWRWGGGYGRGFGMTLIPLLIGIVLLFVDGSSKVGWLLTGGGALIILVGIIANLDIHFRQTSLFNTLLMLTLIMAGLGLIIRSTRAVGAEPPPRA
ncbi:MAG: hypothetical protein KBG28_28795 [Kofleriaceae bacterium]|jgi:hypothetical protein|nr:hypothetical protein [Kofleriaceae bacterium]MBP6838011.1 hypothetical protein [Kofleriaceae bacterium]MBP9207999.1 hypothetical protein [Kofleriaceae bacterium]